MKVKVTALPGHACHGKTLEVVRYWPNWRHFGGDAGPVVELDIRHLAAAGVHGIHKVRHTLALYAKHVTWLTPMPEPPVILPRETKCPKCGRAGFVSFVFHRGDMLAELINCGVCDYTGPFDGDGLEPEPEDRNVAVPAARQPAKVEDDPFDEEEEDPFD